MVKRGVLVALIWLVLGIAGVAADSCTDENCVPVGQWQVNLGLGVGWRSNPLHLGDDAPMIVLPEVSYYGERFFIKNLELGWTLFENDRHQWNLLLTPGTDQMFFNRWDPFNFFDPNGGSLMNGSGTQLGRPESTETVRVRGFWTTDGTGMEGSISNIPGGNGITGGGNPPFVPSIKNPEPIETDLNFDNVQGVIINDQPVNLDGTTLLAGANGNRISVSQESGDWVILGLAEGDRIALLVGGADAKAQDTQDVVLPTYRNFVLLNGELRPSPDFVPQPPLEANPEVDPLEDKIPADAVASRKMAGLAGMEYLYSARYLDLHAQILSDITGVHGGHEVRAAVILPLRTEGSQWALTLGLNYKSRQILDYYYGVHLTDTDHLGLLFEPASAGTAKMLRLDWQKPLSTHFSLRAMAQYTQLPSQIHNSPLVSDHSVSSFFIGGVYHF